MKANELRIGNWVQINNQEWPNLKGVKFKVTSIDCNALMLYSIRGIGNSNYNQYDYNIEPIPLTEEWLLKFGFHKKDAEWYLHPCFELKIIVFNKGEFNGVMFYTRTIHTDFTPIYCTKHINHVHQLQNLYFALTGEELTYGGNK